MGCSSSVQTVSEVPLNSIRIPSACFSTPDASSRSIQIDEELKTYQEHRNVEIKVLLLGAAEAGKSTIVKQVTLTKSQHT